MKEAIGGSYIFQIVIIFIALFSSFIVYSVSYSKAFRVKNQVLDLIEQFQGYTESMTGDDLTVLSDQELMDNGSVEALAYKDIRNYGYKHDILDGNDDLCYTTLDDYNTSTIYNVKGEMKTGGYCVFKKCNNNIANRNTTYKVTAFIALQIPVINVIVKVPISGETKTIYTDASTMECSTGEDDFGEGD